MKIQYCSDLHMEFRENMRFMKSMPLEPVGDVLIIAGDIGYLVAPSLSKEWFTSKTNGICIMAVQTPR